MRLSRRAVSLLLASAAAVSLAYSYPCTRFSLTLSLSHSRPLLTNAKARRGGKFQTGHKLVSLVWIRSAPPVLSSGNLKISPLCLLDRSLKKGQRRLLLLQEHYELTIGAEPRSQMSERRRRPRPSLSGLLTPKICKQAPSKFWSAPPAEPTAGGTHACDRVGPTRRQTDVTYTSFFFLKEEDTRKQRLRLTLGNAQTYFKN